MSQQYTEVEWQDPAGGNPGTLINKARLDQMQTAHHYADGFEEVDTAPTADPGVDYHKVVYCTADSTFYRWDGTQWQKDIDDDTKALLLAHEADHDNPHQVTKAQVGLGNADNTSDADKPISTATQTALDGKLDKQTAGSTQTKVYAVRGSAQRMLNAGYGTGELPLYNYELSLAAKMPTVLDPTDDTVVNYGWANTELDKKADKADTYTKTETDTAMATKADQADTYDKTAVDGLLAGKVDKLISSPAGTYKSVTVNEQGQVTAGTNPTTLAGYGITDAYTKTEADTLLGAKANASEVVTLDTAQTIPGEKQLLKAYTFKKFIQTFGGATAGYRKLWTFSGRGVFNMGAHSVVGQYRALSSARYLVEFYRSIFDSTDNKQTRIYSTANISYEEMVIGANINPAEGEGTFAIYGYMVPSSTMEFMVDTPYNEDGTFKTNFAESNDSTVYSLATIGAIVPIANPYNLVAALDGYLPMVRTSGNQVVLGIKRFTGRNINADQIMTATASSAGKWFKVATLPKQAGAVSRTMLFMFDNAAYSTGWWGMFIMTFGATTILPNLKWIVKNPSWTTDTDSVAVGSSGAFWEIWLRSNATNHKAAISLIDLCTEVLNQEYSITALDPATEPEESAPTSDTSINYIS